MLQPLISVIIPVYNVETFLDACLESVCNQIYKNLEIILIDDGSTDSSGEKCDFWKDRDSRIRVIHKENGGLSDARNVGLKMSTGRLIGFVDSDDVIHPQMYQTLYQIMQETGCQISCCNLKRDESFENFSLEAAQDAQIREYSAQEALEELIKTGEVSVTVWNKLYTRDVIHTIYFERNKYHEDEFWSYRVLANSKKVSVTNQYFYGYRQRSGSIMNERYSIKHLDLLDARLQRLRFLEKHYPQFAAFAKCDLRFECIRAMQFSKMFLEHEELKESELRIKTIHNTFSLRYRDYRILPVGRQFWCFLSNFSLRGTCSIRNRFHFGP